MMDGVSTMDTGNNAGLLQLNIEAIAEVKVLTSAYQAEYGRASGLQITAVTKSGTNQFRGSVYEVRRDSDWNANSWQNKKNNQPKTVTKQDDFGYSIGGPVGKPGAGNKLFFFFSQEWRPRKAGGSHDASACRRRSNAPAISRRRSTTTAPSSVHPRRVHRAAVHGGQHARLLRRRRRGRQDSADELYQIGLNILKQYPMPNLAGAGISYNYEITAPASAL